MDHALLIDGENISSAHAARVMELVPDGARVRRVYGNAATLNGWNAVGGLSVVHVKPAPNAADFLISVDAVALFWRDGVRQYTFATSDGGFLASIAHLREAGANVTLVGEAKTPEILRKMAHRFVELPSAKPSRKHAPPTAQDVIAAQLAAAGPDGMSMAELSRWLQTKHPVGLPAWLGAAGPRAFLEANRDRFDVDPKQPDSRVRLVETGTA